MRGAYGGAAVEVTADARRNSSILNVLSVLLSCGYDADDLLR
jgi:hypothetical protein